MVKLFRNFVLLSFGLYLLWFYFPHVEPLFFDEERLEIWDSSGFDAILQFPIWYYYLWMALYAVISIGLFQFNPWSRDLLIITYIIGFFLNPIYGTVIESPLSRSVGSLIGLIDGIILGMAYFSPISERFKPKAS